MLTIFNILSSVDSAVKCNEMIVELPPHHQTFGLECSTDCLGKHIMPCGEVDSQKKKKNIYFANSKIIIIRT